MMRDYGESTLNFIPQPFYSRVVQEYNRLKGFLPHDHGYVYIIQGIGADFMKIGKSVNPDRRHLQISPTVPFETRVLKVWPSNFMSDAEKWLHSLFDDYRANGEWFSLDIEQLKEMLYGDPYGYSEQIRNAYGFTFLDKVCLSEADEEAFSYWVRTRKGMLREGASWGSCKFISWIDSCFQEIHLTQQTEDLPSDILGPWDRERDRIAEEFESGIGWGGDRP